MYAYIRFYENWNWFIGANIRLNHLDKSFKELKDRSEKDLSENLEDIFIYLILFIILILFVSYKLSNIITINFSKYKQEIQKQNLENEKIKEEVDKNRLLLLESNKLSQAGLMLNSLVHQWYRPLNLIGVKLTRAEIEILNNNFDKNDMLVLINQINNSLKLLEDTTKTFNDFFKQKGKNTKYNLSKSIKDFIFIFDEIFKINKIALSLELDDKITIISNENYLKQVLMSLIFNSVDIFKTRKIENKKITIKLYEKDQKVNLEIFDTAGGISQDLLPKKLFEKQITTKNNSLGLGLYLSKLIVNEKLNGEIYATNSDKGAVFKIVLDKNKNNNL